MEVVLIKAPFLNINGMNLQKLKVWSYIDCHAKSPYIRCFWVLNNKRRTIQQFASRPVQRARGASCEYRWGCQGIWSHDSAWNTKITNFRLTGRRYQDILLFKGRYEFTYRVKEGQRLILTHRFHVTMYYIFVMEIRQSFGDSENLKESISSLNNTFCFGLTSKPILQFGLAWTYLSAVPFSIHSDTNDSRDISSSKLYPRRQRMFGWSREDQSLISLDSIWIRT